MGILAETNTTRVNAMRHYNASIKPTLTDDDDGLLFAIDSNTCQYEYGFCELEVLTRFKARVPGAEVFRLLHPRIWLHAL